MNFREEKFKQMVDFIKTDYRLNDSNRILRSTKYTKRTVEILNKLDLRYLNAIVEKTIEENKIKQIHTVNIENTVHNRFEYICNKLNINLTIENTNKMSDITRKNCTGVYMLSNKKQSSIKILISSYLLKKDISIYLKELIVVFCHECAHAFQFMDNKFIRDSRIKDSRLMLNFSIERTADRLSYLIYNKYFSDLFYINIDKFMNHPLKNKLINNKIVEYPRSVTHKAYNFITKFIDNNNYEIKLTSQSKYEISILKKLMRVLNFKSLNATFISILPNISNIECLPCESYPLYDKNNEIHKTILKLSNVIKYNKTDIMFNLPMQSEKSTRLRVRLFCQDVSYIIISNFIGKSILYKLEDIEEYKEVYQLLQNSINYLGYKIYKKYFKDLININIKEFMCSEKI